jgi:hypothetical protein
LKEISKQENVTREKKRLKPKNKYLLIKVVNTKIKTNRKSQASNHHPSKFMHYGCWFPITKMKQIFNQKCRVGWVTNHSLELG